MLIQLDTVYSSISGILVSCYNNCMFISCNEANKSPLCKLEPGILDLRGEQLNKDTTKTCVLQWLCRSLGNENDYYFRLGGTSIRYFLFYLNDRYGILFQFSFYFIQSKLIIVFPLHITRICLRARIFRRGTLRRKKEC